MCGHRTRPDNNLVGKTSAGSSPGLRRGQRDCGRQAGEMVRSVRPVADYGRISRDSV